MCDIAFEPWVEKVINSLGRLKVAICSRGGYYGDNRLTIIYGGMMEENNQVTQKDDRNKGEKKFPKWGWWVVGIVGAVILVGAGWWVASSKYKAENQKLKNQLSSSSSTSTTSSSTTSTTSSAVDPTAGWKTYTNNEYGFSIKYPSSWSMNGDINTFNGVAFSTQGEMSSKITISGYKSVSDYSEKYNTLEDFIKEQCSDGTANPTTLDSNKAYECDRGVESSEFTIIVQREGKLILIGFPNIIGRDKLTSDQENVLASFKFTK